MTRQLNPGLFNDSAQGYQLEQAMTPLENLAFYDDPNPSFEMLEKLRLEFEKYKFTVQDGQKTASLKVDKLIQRLQLFEERLIMIQKETHEKWIDLGQRVREHGMNDSKIESMIERHNQIVQSFELRISQAQKLIDNQTTQLAKQQQLIDDSRRQIEKLKKL